MLISLSLLIPLIFAALAPLAGLAPRTNQHQIRLVMAIIAPAATLPAIALAIWGAGEQVHAEWLLTGITLAVDQVARGLVLIGALLYGAALLSVMWAKLDTQEPATGALSGFLLASYTGNIGVYLAADAVSFYLFFGLMSFSAVGLVVHYRTSSAHRATRIYLVMTVISETALLAGLILTVQAGGMLLANAPDAVLDSSYTAVVLIVLLIGFGVKAGIAPLHVWLPLAHPAAPPAASAVLSGAMVKAGMVGLLRFFPLQDLGSGFNPTIELFGWILLILALISAFGSVIIGVAQHDAKTILAYSTISQMGFIVALIAAGLIDANLAQDTADAAVLYAIHHGLAKGALFLGVPVVKHYGRGAAGVLVTIGMVGAGLAVAGAPITSGGLGKYVGKDAVAGLTVAGIGLDYLLPFVATGSVLLLMRFVWSMLAEERQAHQSIDGELIAWLAVCLAGIGVPWLVGAYWSPLGLPDWTDPQVVWDSVWPIGLGLVAGGLVWLADHFGWLPDRTRQQPIIPAGDLVVLGEYGVRGMMKHGGAWLQAVHSWTTNVRSGGKKLASGTAGLVQNTTENINDRFRPWPRFGTSAVVIVTLVLVGSLMIAGGA
jgi:formate hydrogenlyase subunit 3/multisubunit Na+/H+ antiporter MnhD subunit